MSLIVFGWYSFRIKSFTRTELDVEATEVDIEYQIRQKVFHIMYIPVFPIGKQFAMKVRDHLQPVSNEIHEAIKKKEKVKTPWYSFSLPLLLCLSLFLFYSNQELREYLYRKHVREEFNMKQRQISKEIEHLSKYHYIELRQVDNWNTSIIYYLKIENVNAAKIDASKIESGIGIFDSPRKVRESYILLNDSLPKISIDKDQFKKMQLYDPEVYLNRMTYGYKYPTDCGFDLFSDGKRYIINDIYYFNGPVLAYSGKVWSSRTGLDLSYTNYGDKARLTKIENLEGFSAKWNTVLPLNIDSHFSISTEDIPGIDKRYGIQLTFEDSLNNVFTFVAYKYRNHEVVQRLFPMEKIKTIVN
jgi:hypothetical protein